VLVSYVQMDTASVTVYVQSALEATQALVPPVHLQSVIQPVQSALEVAPVFPEQVFASHFPGVPLS